MRIDQNSRRQMSFTVWAGQNVVGGRVGSRSQSLALGERWWTTMHVFRVSSVFLDSLLPLDARAVLAKSPARK